MIQEQATSKSNKMFVDLVADDGNDEKRFLKRIIRVTDDWSVSFLQHLLVIGRASTEMFRWSKSSFNKIQNDNQSVFGVQATCNDNSNKRRGSVS